MKFKLCFVLIFVCLLICKTGFQQVIVNRDSSSQYINAGDFIIKADTLSVKKSNASFSGKNLKVGITNINDTTWLSGFENNEWINFDCDATGNLESQEIILYFNLGINKTYQLFDLFDVHTGQNGMTLLLGCINENGNKKLKTEFTAGLGTIITMSIPGNTGSVYLSFVSLPPLVPREIGLRTIFNISNTLVDLDRIEIIKDTKFSILKLPDESFISLGMVLKKGSSIVKSGERFFINGDSRISITLTPPAFPILKVSLNIAKINIDSKIDETGIRGVSKNSIGIGDVLTFSSSDTYYDITFDPPTIVSEGILTFNGDIFNTAAKKGKIIINGNESSIYFEENGKIIDIFKRYF